jgi:hypothetical protein
MAKLYTKNTWTDEVLAGDERYNLKADDGTPIESNVQIELATAVAQAGTAVDAEKMNNIENGVDAIDTLVDTINGQVTNLQLGWIALPTCTYVSATSFTLAGDWTSFLKLGAKFKCTNTTLKYGYILSSSYSSGTGLTTCNLVANADFALASAAISGASISYSNPPDFPQWFSYSPVITGYSTPPPVSRYRFCITGKTAHVVMREGDGGLGTSNNVQTTYSLPVVSTHGNMYFAGHVPTIVDNGVTLYTGSWRIPVTGDVVQLFSTLAGGGWTASGGKSAAYANGLEFFYEL